MTKIENRIRKAGLDPKFFNPQTNAVEILVKDSDGQTMQTLTDYLREVFWGKVAKWGGFKTGYGSWILTPDYKINYLVSENID